MTDRTDVDAFEAATNNGTLSHLSSLGFAIPYLRDHLRRIANP